MNQEERNRVFELCPLIATENDVAKYDVLIGELQAILGAKQDRLENDSALDKLDPEAGEERLLIARWEACRAVEMAAALHLSNPGHSILYPEYLRLVNAHKAIRAECNRKRLAFQTLHAKRKAAAIKSYRQL